MLLAYVDESYSKDYFFLAAVIVDSQSAVEIETGLDAIVDEYARMTSLSVEAELHGHELFNGHGEWGSLQIRQQINVYGRALEVIGKSGAHVVLRGMNVARQKERYGENAWPPHDVVLGHLLENIDSVATELDDCLVVVADEIHSSERHRVNFRGYRANGTPGYRSSRLPSLVDTIHFGPSKHSRLLQAADLVAFMHHRRSAIVESDARQARAIEQMWVHVEPCVKRRWTWEPSPLP
ncbi:DUF3800 domain-containing protein [Promicromonospora sp. Populi]|uniref:DUF3800 domain-containing protein n=1 Tax=Promicromonospora sp. Populi TaxID=3239420 RepID=UPI0034E2C23E